MVGKDKKAQRSDKVRKYLDEIPNRLVLCGNIVVFIIVFALIISACFLTVL